MNYFLFLALLFSVRCSKSNAMAIVELQCNAMVVVDLKCNTMVVKCFPLNFACPLHVFHCCLSYIILILHYAIQSCQGSWRDGEVQNLSGKKMGPRFKTLPSHMHVDMQVQTMVVRLVGVDQVSSDFDIREPLRHRI